MVVDGARRGHTFGQPDLFIAAIAALDDLVVVSRDTTQFVVAGAPVFDPWASVLYAKGDAYAMGRPATAKAVGAALRKKSAWVRERLLLAPSPCLPAGISLEPASKLFRSLARHLLHDKPRPLPLRQPLGQKRQHREASASKPNGGLMTTRPARFRRSACSADAKLYPQHAAYSGLTKTFDKAFCLRQILDWMPQYINAGGPFAIGGAKGVEHRAKFVRLLERRVDQHEAAPLDRRHEGAGGGVTVEIYCLYSLVAGEPPAQRGEGVLAQLAENGAIVLAQKPLRQQRRAGINSWPPVLKRPQSVDIRREQITASGGAPRDRPAVRRRSATPPCVRLPRQRGRRRPRRHGCRACENAHFCA